MVDINRVSSNSRDLRRPHFLVVNLRHIHVFRCHTAFSSKTGYNLFIMTAGFKIILEAEDAANWSVKKQEDHDGP